MSVISWDHLSDFIQRGIPAQLPAVVNSSICFLVTGDATSLTLRVPSSPSSVPPISPYLELEISEKFAEGEAVVEIKVADPELYRPFYMLSMEIINRLSLSPNHVHEAISKALSSWTSLLLRRSLLSESEQTGLIGELAVLACLMSQSGVSAFDAWLGPLGEEHDFRLGNLEIEVKSTTRNERLHRINGLSQLEASPGMELCVLSLQFERAGAAMGGRTLADWVHKTRVALQQKHELLKRFDGYLEELGYINDTADLYVAKYKFRGPPIIIPVISGFPRITRSSIDGLVSSSRIHEVEYDVNLEGMGWAEGSSEYSKILKCGPMGSI